MAIARRRELERKAQRLEALVREVDDLADLAARNAAVAAIQALLELHRDGLERLLELAGPEVVRRLARDPVVGCLLLVHDLHPLSLEERVRGALERVRPYLGSHGGGVELLGIEGGVVRLRLEGSCHGCPSSTATVRYAIEQAIGEEAPDVAGVEVEGAGESVPAGFVPLSSVGRAQSKDAEWHQLRDLATDEGLPVSVLELGGARVALCRAAGERYAYLDRCPGCAGGLNGAQLTGTELRCPGCGRRFDVRLAGRCLDEPGLHLEPLPLLAEEGELRVAVPQAAVRS